MLIKVTTNLQDKPIHRHFPFLYFFTYVSDFASLKTNLGSRKRLFRKSVTITKWYTWSPSICLFARLLLSVWTPGSVVFLGLHSECIKVLFCCCHSILTLDGTAMTAKRKRGCVNEKCRQAWGRIWHQASHHTWCIKFVSLPTCLLFIRTAKTKLMMRMSV